jgi:predicted PurR-regulated permease PerM
VLLAGRVIWPLSDALAWSAVLSFFTYPVYRFIHQKIFRGKWSYFAAALNTTLSIFLLVLPMLGLATTAIKEFGKLYQVFVEWFPTVRGRSLGSILSIPQLDRLLSRYPDFFELPMWSDLVSNLPGTLMSFVRRLSAGLLGNTLQMGFNLLVVTVGSFFLTHDGEKFLIFVRQILPLSSPERDVLFTRARQMLYAIFYGIILTAGVQAALGGLGWWYVGLPNAVIFALLMFFLAMIPMLGTPLVIVPGSIYLWATGDTKHAIMLLVWGIVLVSSIDNFLRPLFIYEGTKAPVLMIFAGILGGISTWGFLGLFMGPLVLSTAYFMIILYHNATFSPETDTSPEASDEAPPPS